VKLRFRRKRITIVGISFGFLVVTRMLQKYPELAKKVDVLVSIVGFMHRDDFVYTRVQRQIFRRATRLFATPPVALIIRYGFLNKYMLRKFYMKMPNSKRRFIEVTEAEFNRTMDFEVKLWQANDVRTHWLTTSEFLNVDNCTARVKLPIYHVASKHDHYFNNEMVKQHMQVVFKPYRQFMAGSKAHTPSILADVKAVQVFLPAGLRRVLNKT
jgi:pimeloyl-ACP methyl ester carboxylesterase